MQKRVLVLGGSGMLGAMVVDFLSRDPGLAVAATVRDEGLAAACARRLPSVHWSVFDAEAAETSLRTLVAGRDWVINAIGITKPLIRDDNAAQVERAVRVNALFPHFLAAQASREGARVLQIATDCVFSGQKGSYAETDVHDALDAYGKTKSLGEVPGPGFHNLRCSIIGPEPKDFKFLLEWLLGQSRGARVNGFTDHRWNGLTTLHFAKLCHGIIRRSPALKGLQHLVPAGTVTKAELLETLAAAYGREDIAVQETCSAKAVDRVLAATDAAHNERLWAAAGYSALPTVPDQVAELSRFDFRLAGLLAAEKAAA